VVALSSEEDGVNLSLSYPWFFVALAALPLLVLGQRRSLAAFTPAQRKVCFLLRTLILLCLVFALVGLRVFLPSNETTVLFAVDDSASIAPEARKAARDYVASALAGQRSGDLAGVVGFAEEPRVWQSASTKLALGEWPRVDAGRSTDLAKAIHFSSALFPTGQTRRIVLLSDGNETTGNTTEAIAQLRRAGVEVWTVPLRNPTRPEVLVERVDVPSRLREGEPFDLNANLHSNVETKAKVRVYQSQFLVAERTVDLKPGNNDFRVPSLRPDGSFVPFEVEIVPDLDTSIENNRGSAVASMRGQPRVLIVDGDMEKARPLADALRAERITVDLRGPSGAPRTLTDLQQFDLFLLSDLSALTLGREPMELYRRWVQDFGGGFMLLGGENSYGVGGYSRTPVEQMLPVRMEHNDRQELPTVALMIVLDRSGSMTAMVAGQTKMALANQGAALALNVLSPRDYFGVLAVDTRAHVVAPLARHGAKEPIAQKVLSVTAGGGGIYVYTSLAESLQAMRDVNARIKHVILFSDAADAEEKNAGEQVDGAQGSGTALDLAASMVAAKITVSVVALGSEQDKDTAFLRQLAERGQGRFYLTSDATTLPQIFSTETMKVAQSSLIEEPTQAIVVQAAPMLAGLDWTQSPLLLGYNATKPKPSADILLATERGEPLLATWRYGLGQTAAFTSDAKARWASEWLAWPGYTKFWTQVARGLLRKSGAAAFEINRRELSDRLELQIDAMTPEGGFRNQLPITVTARDANDPANAMRKIEAQQIAPGSYRAELPLPTEGTTVINVSSPELPDGGVALAHTRSYPREYLAQTTNEKLLRDLATTTGGRFDPPPGEVFQQSSGAAVKSHDLTNAFLIAALLLMPLDIFLRRRTWAVTSSASNPSP
jgi:Ca-activated chloride channel homolog